ncbi:hypothetical protein J1N35_005208 [Gossypium stocksii]|uniref:DUF4283 domain-containing protein n=1 Tax=Gossypium stocksii TaxID=47602 RepID=A0A9D3WEW7_9ROSI|nr:hypothetical protein J1N35_005208 [Gossypium stocksii]
MVDLEEDFELQDGDVTTVLVGGVPSITLFDRVQQFITRKMALIVVVKLLGNKIGFNTLFNKDKDDFDKILMCSPWVIFGHYLTIRHWPSNFSTANTEVDNQIVWISLPSLSEGYYSIMLLQAIRQAIGPMIKINEHANVTIQGRFAWLAVCVDLRKPLIFKVQINGKTYRVEYKYLSNIYFTCGLYGHTTALYLGENIGMMENLTNTTTPVTEESDLINRVKKEPFGPWMLLEQKQRGRFKGSAMVVNGGQDNRSRGLRFSVLEEGGIGNAAINHGVDFVAKEGNNEVTVDLPRCGRDKFEGDC